MRYLVLKDQFRRKKQKRFEVKRSVLKFFMNNDFNYSKKYGYKLSKRLSYFSKNTCFISKNRCLLTKRSRFVFRTFGLERRVLRNDLLYGRVTAVRRILW